MKEAMEMAKECLGGYSLCCEEDGGVILPPSSATEISAEAIANELECEYTDSFVITVTLDVKILE